MAVFFIGIYKPFQKQNWFLTIFNVFGTRQCVFMGLFKFFERVPIDFA